MKNVSSIRRVAFFTLALLLSFTVTCKKQTSRLGDGDTVLNITRKKSRRE
ncbi:hypothetical protein GF338_04270 [candidate division WOR-3 bacterium]|nr:hypothetical protein [candidate division WOR-3 bacterium]